MSESKEAFDNNHKAYVEQKLIEDGEAGEWEVVLPFFNQLQLDYDQPFPYYPPQFFEVLDMLKERLKGEINHKVYSSRSGNTHYIIDLPVVMGDLERVAWQAAFGSDPKREAGHLLSLARGDAHPILLIMRKDRQ